MQLMPATAATRVDPTTCSGNIDGGATYLAQLLDRFEGDLPKALAAYNAGPERWSAITACRPIPKPRPMCAPSWAGWPSARQPCWPELGAE